MKPASITLRQPRAGVFFWPIGIMVECNLTKMLEPRNGQLALGGKLVHDLLGSSLGRRYSNSSTGGTLNFGFCRVFCIGVDQPCRDHQLCGVFNTHV